jgi:hypothetical protein
VAVRATFGLLVSDTPGSFSWVCEPGFGLAEDQDPPIALASQDRILVTPLQGPRRSDPGACSFAGVEGVPPGELALDVSVERAVPSRAVLLTWSSLTRRTSVYASVDAGATWVLRGSPPETDGIPTTLDVAPSQPERLVLAGAFSQGGKLRGYVSRSDDGGLTWGDRAEVDLADDEKGLYLSAIDPQDASRVYARTSGGAQDRLLVSGDGGATFTELTRVSGAMLGFALSPDGARVAIGGPLSGVRVAARGSANFVQRRAASTSCLAWSDGGLYACGSGLAGDFVLGRSLDDGLSWAPLLARLADLEGPTPRCPEGSGVAAACEPLWPAQRQQLAAIGAAGAEGVGGDAGAAGAGGTAAAGASPGVAGGPGVAPPPGEGACGCRAVGDRGYGGALAPLLALLLGCRRRARSCRGLAS